jgi:5-hydroxyisourate hydrolase-like protein (transthyretin family)
MILGNLLKCNKLAIGLVILMLVVFPSCKRSGMGYVRGTVIDVTTGLPVEGIEVRVTDMKHSSTHRNVTGTDVSDSEGNYEIKYYKKKFRRYFISAESTADYINNSGQEIDLKKYAYTVEVYHR